ncbi:MAG TPA: tyrosine-protein phosphatase [bacterium]|nr:tyrosine-protein phosphatase [bacterium]HNS48661.1 tyrosine-protein phosphatase [bacterium]
MKSKRLPGRFFERVFHPGLLFLREYYHLWTVSPGLVYRACQYRRRRLAEVIRALGLRSVLNLRGANPRARWWRDEVEICARLGVGHYDLNLSARQVPSPKQLEELVRILASAPKPLLFHCEGGGSRTGLASAIYKYRFEGLSCRRARRQFSVIYGHFPLFHPSTRAMERAFLDFCRISGSGRPLPE